MGMKRATEGRVRSKESMKGREGRERGSRATMEGHREGLLVASGGRVSPRGSKRTRKNEKIVLGKARTEGKREMQEGNEGCRKEKVGWQIQRAYNNGGDDTLMYVGEQRL